MGRESPGVSIFDWGTLVGVTQCAKVFLCAQITKEKADASHLTIPSHPGVICTLGIEQNGARRRHVTRGHEFQPFTLSHDSVNLLSLAYQSINPEAHAVPHNPMVSSTGNSIQSAQQ
ncbi:hypothetical protein FB45DRAFT_862173 [Roridomyces roridus]|uniref:Uncharacterized protein n=1 Tax=Roridomyces roridus TaxID=1738132 RepID=A0AAD7CCM1_9AGAR|nr:hypothetical protein FB45DRAFT_862173 [Roridomyces roridus]